MKKVVQISLVVPEDLIPLYEAVNQAVIQGLESLNMPEQIQKIADVEKTIFVQGLKQLVGMFQLSGVSICAFCEKRFVCTEDNNCLKLIE